MFKILNGYENINTSIFFALKTNRRTRGHVTSDVSEATVLIRFQKVTIFTEDNKLMEQNNCVNASSMNMFKNQNGKYLILTGTASQQELMFVMHNLNVVID